RTSRFAIDVRMKEDRRNRSWFALLRRDGLAFALAAIFLVIMQPTQPLAAVPATPLDVGAAICRTGEAFSFAPVGDHGSHTHDCRHCVAGPCAGLALAPYDDGTHSTAWRPRRDSSRPACAAAAMLLAGSAGDPPPAIRAPPPSV